MKVSGFLNGAANVVILGAVAFLLFRPTGPIGEMVVKRREAAATRKSIAEHWPALSQSTVRLDANAGAATVIEFSDFECPYCKRQSTILKQAMRENPNLRVVYVHFPIPSHTAAEGAARAAICAEPSGKFPLLANRFFETETWQRDTNWVAEASAVGIDTIGYRNCLHSPGTDARLASDKLFATKLGISSTPSFVSKRGIYPGLRTDSLLTEIIQDER